MGMTHGPYFHQPYRHLQRIADDAGYFGIVIEGHFKSRDLVTLTSPVLRCGLGQSGRPTRAFRPLRRRKVIKIDLKPLRWILRLLRGPIHLSPTRRIP